MRASKSVSNIVLDETKLAAFLQNGLDRDWFHLYFISADDPKAKPQGFVARSIPEAIAIIRRENGARRNAYYGLNVPSYRQRKKAKVQELEWLYGVYGDLDLPEGMRRDSPDAKAALEALRRGVANLPDSFPAHPMVVSTGNGVQVAWFFAEPIPATEENIVAVETLNKRIARAFKQLFPETVVKVDSVHNAERILRIPHTINWPTAKKLAKGCQPVMAELIALPGGVVDEASFTRLPRCAKTQYRENPEYHDYCLDSYTDGYQPWTGDDFLAELPDIDRRVANTLREHPDDRSAGVWTLLRDVCDFVERKEGVGPAELKDSTDLKKCASHICWELADVCPAVEYALQHVVDHQYGRAKLGYDLERALNGRMDDGITGSAPAAEARAERRLAVHEANQAPEDQVSVEAATVAFLAHVEGSFSRERLPNVMMGGKGQAAPAQGSTRANVRAILAAAAITPRWDVMRDQARFIVDPVIGTSGGSPTRPAFHFARAVSRASENDRSRAEMALIIDAMFAFGLSQRPVIAEHIEEIARENAFHPLEEYATSRPWDGVDRYGEVAACLTTRHPLVVTYMRTFFRSTVGAVKSFRKFLHVQDGLEMSASVVLIGPQSIGKSTFWRMLTPPGFLSTGSRLAIGQHGEADSMKRCLSGLVCVLNELGATHKRSEADALKDFLSSTVDNYRPAFGRVAIIKPRMTVFTGTANQDFMLRDVTGDRRYLCIEVEAIDRERVAKLDLQQLYAQAWHEVIDKGEKWWLEAEEDRVREEANVRFREEGEEAGTVRDYLSHLPAGVEVQWLTATQVCRLLRLRYAPHTWHKITPVLEEFGCEHRNRMRRKNGPDLRKVWGFPVLPERYRNLLAGAA